MDQFYKRLNFVIDDIHQLLSVTSDINFQIAMLNAYRAILTLQSYFPLKDFTNEKI